DANTFVYHFVPHPVFKAACESLLERIGRQELTGFTTADVVSDVAHRTMTLEAASTFGWPIAGIAQRLRKHAAEIPKLNTYRQAVHAVPQMGIRVLPVTLDLVLSAADISQKYGLLSGDALVVAAMLAHGLKNLASHDADFDRVAGIT